MRVSAAWKHSQPKFDSRLRLPERWIIPNGQWRQKLETMIALDNDQPRQTTFPFPNRIFEPWVARHPYGYGSFHRTISYFTFHILVCDDWHSRTALNNSNRNYSSRGTYLFVRAHERKRCGSSNEEQLQDHSILLILLIKFFLCPFQTIHTYIYGYALLYNPYCVQE